MLKQVSRGQVKRGGKGLGHTGNLDHVEPAHGVLVTSFDGFERAVWSDDCLWRETAHAEKHVQDIGEALGLVIVVWGTLVEGPLVG